MRELTYTLLDLERSSWKTCDFCSNCYGEDNKSVNQIVARVKVNGKYVADDVVCENCKEKFENDELEKCERCGRLQTKHYIDVHGDKYVCFCIRYEEDMEEKELPLLPSEEISQSAFYERQINGLQEELATAEEALEIEREEIAKFQEKSEEWNKRQKQELLDKIKQQETEIIKLTQKIEQLKTLTPQELVNKLNACEAENEKLKNQLEQLQQNGQLTAQIEIKETKKWPWLKIRK